jgi:hypothetical protein
MIRLFLLILTIFCSSALSYLNQGYPECASLAFCADGRVDLTTMLYNCTKNIPGSSVIPSFYPYENNTFHPVDVMIGIVINNLINVNDVTSQVTLDFWYRNIWEDPRIFLPPETWSYLNPETLLEGLDITQYIYTDGNPLPIWFPDIVFYEGVDLNQLAQMVKLFPNGTIFWSRHYMVTLTEATMNLIKYPLDNQNYTMTFQSYAYDSNFLTISLFPKAISFNVDDQSGINYVDMNQLWTYNYFTAYSIIVPSPVLLNPNRKYSTAYLNMRFQRQSLGVVYRLGLPIAMFLVLVGFSFWADINKRIDVTLQMLLVVSALYLVIGQIIPFVGYFTRMDLYITTAVLVLVMTTGIHFCTLLLERKVDKYPANGFIRDCMVFFFRMIWVPAALLIFILFFNVSQAGIIAAVSVTAAISVSNGFLNRKYLTQSFKIAVLNLREKERLINEANKSILTKKEDVKQSEEGLGYVRKTRQLSTVEAFILNNTRKMYLGRLYRNRTAAVQQLSRDMVNQLNDPQDVELEMASVSKHHQQHDSADENPVGDNPLHNVKPSTRTEGKFVYNPHCVDSDDES